MTKGARILIISKHTLVGEAFKEYFRNHARDYQVQVQLFSRLTEVPARFHPALILFVGLEQNPADVKAAMNSYPLAKYLLIGKINDIAVSMQWLRLGIHGLVDESSDFNNLQTLEKAMTKVQAGEIWASRRVISDMSQGDRQLVSKQDSLTRREEEVMQLVNLGLSNPSIGKRLRISEKTVKRHLTNIYKKLQVANRVQAVLKQQQAPASLGRLYRFPAVNS